VAVVVESASGEQVYLPPEDFERPPEGRAQRQSSYQPPKGDSAYQPPKGDSAYQPPSGDSAYQPPKGDSAYQPPRGDSAYQPPKGDSAYQPPKRNEPGDTAYQTVTRRREPGLRSTPGGFEIVHPEPVTDVRVLR
jgi:hypothetical protein